MNNLLKWYDGMQYRLIDTIGYDNVIRLGDATLFIAGILFGVILMIFIGASIKYKTRSLSRKEFKQFCTIVIKDEDNNKSIIYGTPKNFFESIQYVVTILFFPRHFTKKTYTLKNDKKPKIFILILLSLAFIFLFIAILSTMSVLVAY